MGQHTGLGSHLVRTRVFFKQSEPSGSRRTPASSQCWHCSRGHCPGQEELLAQSSKRAVVGWQLEFQGGVCGQSSLQAASPAELILGSPAGTEGRGMQPQHRVPAEQLFLTKELLPNTIQGTYWQEELARGRRGPSCVHLPP